MHSFLIVFFIEEAVIPDNRTLCTLTWLNSATYKLGLSDNIKLR